MYRRILKKFLGPLHFLKSDQMIKHQILFKRFLAQTKNFLAYSHLQIYILYLLMILKIMNVFPIVKYNLSEYIRQHNKF